MNPRTMGKRLLVMSFLTAVILFGGSGCASISREAFTRNSDWRSGWVRDEIITELQATKEIAVLSSEEFAKIIFTVKVDGGLILSDVLTNLPPSSFIDDNEFLVIKEKAVLRRALPFSTDPMDVEWNRTLGNIMMYPGDLILQRGIE